MLYIEIFHVNPRATLKMSFHDLYMLIGKGTTTYTMFSGVGTGGGGVAGGGGS